MAMLLSLCGVRVDMGLEPYLPPPWHEMILGPTSALTQTQFYNLRNHLGDDHDLHPKNIDLDGFFTTRRLLGWVRSLDRLQVGTRVHFSLHLKPMQMESEFCSSNRENIPRRLTLYSLDLTEVLTDPIVIPSLQVPHTELETWLVQQEANPLPMVCPDLLERAPVGGERDRTAPTVEATAELGTLQEEEEEDKEVY